MKGNANEVQGRVQTSLVTEDMTVNLSPVFKQTEDRVQLGHEYLKNNILKCFRWPILNGNETVSSKYYFLRKCFLDSYLENAMRSTMR